MATITATVRENLIGIYMGMFKKAPGADAVSEMVVLWEGGKNQKQVAAELAKKAAFAAEYPQLQLPQEFADEVVAWLASEATSAGKTWATNWIIGKVNAGVSKSDIIVEAVLALRVATNTTDFGLAKNNLNNKVEVGVYYAVTKDQKADSADAIATVTSAASTVTSAKTEIDSDASAAAGQTYTLTANVDTVSGTSGDDTINGTINTGGTSTLTALDTINGGAGNDTVVVSAITDLLATSAPGLTVTNVENVKIAAAAKVGTFTANGTGDLDLSTTFGGITGLTISGAATAIDIKAPSTAAVTVSGATGGVEVVGGTTQSVTLAAQGGALQLSKATGNVTVTSSAQGANTITIDDGVQVNVTAGMSATAATTQGAITIGGTTKPTGAVTVTNTVSNAAGANSTGAAVTVSGGSTVTVNQTATQAALTTAGANNTLTQGKVIVNGGTSTTSVTVSQSDTATAANTVLGVTGVTEINTLTFKALTSGQTLIINGLTFTAGTAGTTAAETAAAFANLESGARQGYSTKGTYDGTWTAGTFTSGAASGDTVVFTGTSAGVRTNLADTGTGADPTVVETTAGVAAVTAAGRGAIVQGAVEVDDVAVGTEVDTLTTASVTGYATGSFVKSDALTTLTLAKNTASASMAVHNNTATALTLNLDTLRTGSTVNLDAAAAKYTTLTVNTSGGDSVANITAAAVTALTVDGSKAVDLSSSTFTALKTLTVKGSAGVTANISALASQEAVDTSASTGTSTITLDATKAKYTGGAGVDKVTLSAVAPSKAVSLGGGDDTLTLATGTTTATGVMSGGDGSDTLIMAMADAVTASGATTFQASFDGFEKFQVNGLAGGAAGTVNVANLDNINYVINNQVATVTAVAQVSTLAITGSTDNALDTVTLTLSNGTYTTDAGIYADGTAIATNLAAKINAGATHTATSSGSTLTITAAAAGTAFTFTSIAPTSNGGAADTATGTFTTTTANVAAGTASGLLTIDNLASGGTVELSAGGAGATVLVKDASTGTADVLNVVTKVGTADLTHGTLTAANVETVNLTVTDTSTTAGINKSTLTLTADKATAVTVTGNAALALTMTSSTKVTSIDGSAMTGALTVTSLNTTSATTIKGGSGADALTAATGTTADVLIGGDGADTLTTNAGLTTLTGGAGNDTFVIGTASANVNSYATITDASKGDYIRFNATAGTEKFISGKVTLGDTAVFQDYANAAINTTLQGEVAWFQYSGNTYIVQEADGARTAFLNGTDFIVKLTGLVDLSTASFDTGAFEVRIG